MNEEVLDTIAFARAKFGVPYVPCNGNRQAAIYSFFVAALACSLRKNLGREIISVKYTKYRRRKVSTSFGYSLKDITRISGRKNHANVIHHTKYHEQNMKIEGYRLFYLYFDEQFAAIRERHWPKAI